jgi:hypothetical protein
MYDKTRDNQIVSCTKFRKETAPPFVYPADFASEPITLSDEITSNMI